MFPLLFMPFQAGDAGVDQLDNLPLCYDLKCSEEFGVGAMNVSIQEKINIREPIYNVSINTVKVMADMTVCQSDTGEITSGLVTNSWTTRRVMKLNSGDREVITRHVRNKGDYFTVENLFGETDIINNCSNNEGKNQENSKKSRKKKLGNYDVKVDGQEENFDENIIKIPAANLSNFISEPASIVMEKIFAGRKTEVSLADLKTLNDTGDIIKVSYNSKVLENSVEIVKTLNCADSSDITLKSVEMDFEGNILTCKYEDITWIRDTENHQVQLYNIHLPPSYNIALYHEGRLEKLLKQEEYRKHKTDFTNICRDLLQYLLMNKPSQPIAAIQEYFKQMTQDQ